MAQMAPIDPTKLGQGRAIAVLTSGGDAQGKSRNSCVPCECGVPRLGMSAVCFSQQVAEKRASEALELIMAGFNDEEVFYFKMSQII